ncbi:MAG TPA: class I adenylate-forming enzyme family protein [Hyphomonadaceae bacterium]|nr:class I adenylate-forming enzyme family protein [Hyphomonadaceae bacterium]
MTTRLEALAALTAPGQPHEIIKIEAIGRQIRAFKNAPVNLGQLYSQARSDKPFLVYEDERLSFEETWRRACTLAHVLVNEYGVKKGDRIAIAMRNYPEWMISFMAATSIGALTVAVNALWTADEMSYGIGLAQPKVAFIDQERIDRLNMLTNLPADLKLIGVRTTKPLPANVRSYTDVMSAPEQSELPDVDVLPDDDAIMLFTSGSTGHPKGAVSTHRNVLHALVSWELDLIASFATGLIERPPADAPQAASLLVIPLFHVTGLHSVALSCFRLQRRLVSMYKWEVEKGADIIEREGITNFTATPAITGDLVIYSRETGRHFPSLSAVGGGGASRAPEQVRAIDAVFAKAMPATGWGMTETNAIGVGIAAADYLRKPESSGRVSAVLDVRIVDEAGNELPTGQRGELQIRGASIMRGYYKRPDANASEFVNNDWFRTGDVAYIDDEGFVFIVDRIKDLVIRGGENIGCGAVEYALQEHPSVVEACVYGVPDERLGEEVGTTIYADKPVTEAELRDFLSTRLGKFQIPRYFQFESEPLPRGATGKIMKKDLRVEAAKRWAQS